MTSSAPQLRENAMLRQRHPVSATRAHSVGSKRRWCHDCPPAGERVDDFEGVMREDHGAVAHEDDRFFWTGAEHWVPRATAQRALNVENQSGPPCCYSRSPVLPCTHGKIGRASCRERG